MVINFIYVLVYFLLIKQFLDDDVDDFQNNIKVQKLSNDFRKSDQSDDDILVSNM